MLGYWLIPLGVSIPVVVSAGKTVPTPREDALPRALINLGGTHEECRRFQESSECVGVSLTSTRLDIPKSHLRSCRTDWESAVCNRVAQ